MMKFLSALSLIALISACANGPNQVTTSGGSIAPGTTTFTVSAANAPTSYTINTIENPTLSLQRGQTYTFNVTAVGHPFYIMSIQGTNILNAYNSGVTGNSVQNGTVTFVVPMGAPNMLYYDCSVHSGMTGVINITN